MSRLFIPRRSVLKGLGASAGLAACGAPGTPRAPTPKERGRIDTIVLCMMENRSFDHVFGSLALSEGRTEIDGLTAQMSNPDLDGNEVFATPSADDELCVVNDPPHGWDSSRVQLDGGTNRGFVRAFQQSHGASAPVLFPMSYLVRAQQPVTYALSDAYATCQRWFSSVLTSTWPNRIYFHAAQSQGIASNTLPLDGPFSCRTIWDQLTEAGVDWAYYYTDLPTLSLFGREEWVDRMRPITTFYVDVEQGTLPSVVCVDPGAGFNDDHPPHHPLLGQIFLGSVYAALARSSYWERCAFLYTYDEAGGFFDHVPPGTMPDDFADQGFDQLGFRVPAVMAGPYVRNVVDDTPFDHSAAIRFVQEHFGITERLTKRDAASNDPGVLLDADRLAANDPAPPIELPPIDRSEEELDEECSRLGGRTGQPELRAFVRERFPRLDLTAELPRTSRLLLRRAAELGVWRPR